MRREKLVERSDVGNEDNDQETQTEDANYWEFLAMDGEFTRSRDFWIKVKGQNDFHLSKVSIRIGLKLFTIIGVL